MTIDIISYTEEQYAGLAATQMQKIREAQLKKDRLQIRLDEELRKEKERLVANGTFHSGIFDRIAEKLQAEYDEEVEVIREGLNVYLETSMRPEGTEDQEAPYVVNYALSEYERYTIVKEYYETTYTNGTELFEVFKTDTVAPEYLGDLYAPLYDYFQEGA